MKAAPCTRWARATYLAARHLLQGNSAMALYEHSSQPLLPRKEFIRRFLRHVAIAFVMILASLLIGVSGYHFLEGLSWVDSILNASMILGGMGPVNPIQTNAGKLFASAYALFSGMIFLVITGLLFAPLFHRFLHHFHMEAEELQEGGQDQPG
jgi:hypothetical protein